jgi:hypothetical protein
VLVADLRGPFLSNEEPQVLALGCDGPAALLLLLLLLLLSSELAAVVLDGEALGT